MNLIQVKQIELTEGQLNILRNFFEGDLDFESVFRIDKIIVLTDGNIQVYYNDGSPKVKDISIYD